MCPDNTKAIRRGELHACCGELPEQYCVLCARITKGHDTTCTTHCNGTIHRAVEKTKSESYCDKCVCLQVDKKRAEKEEKTRKRCPMGFG